MIIREKVRIGDQVVTLETGRIAKQAGGSCLVRAGDTIVLVTACGNQEPKPGQGFFPLSVDYQEKTYAAGKIPGGFFKREGKLRDYEVLTSRLIDRPCRPLFPEGYLAEVQIVATVMSFDQQNPPDTLALIGASAALHISQIPWSGPIAGVRVGRVDGEFVANPTFEQMANSDCELLVAASRDAIVMVEGEADEMTEEDMIEALLFGHRAVQDTLDLIERMRAAVGKPKWLFAGDTIPVILRERLRQVAGFKVREACSIANKAARSDAFKQLRREALELLAPEFPGQDDAIKSAFEDLRYQTMRGQVLEEGRRLDGRDTRTVRPISIELGVLPRTHGSSLFTRGETQAIVTGTLGTARDSQRLDTLQGDQHKRFMLHYNFPPYSVGEVKPMRGPGRREVGHGNLAERALAKVLPSQEEFPYSIRIVSEITESNGSSSMASVCGGALALMDAGVPIKAPVAGVAMGLIKEGDSYAVLTDILGDEDALGDMDFKVCGTDKGVTAIQMDIKIEGLSREILERSLRQAREARLHILDKMQRAIPAPREELSPYAPRITQIRVKPDQVRTIIGPGGKMIRAIVDQTGAAIDVEDDGTVSVSSADSAAVAKALEIIKSLTTEPEIGEIYEGTVKRIEPYGAFLEILPGKDGLCHISDIDWSHVTNVEDYMKLGDKVPVKLTNIDREGRIRLSRKDAIPEPIGLSKLNGRGSEERGFEKPREERAGREREERPARAREERAARPRELEREERPAKPREDRRARELEPERPARARDLEPERVARPARDLEPERVARPARDLEPERVARPARDLEPERVARPARDLEPERAARPARDLEREDRPARRDFDRDERPLGKPRDLEREERAVAKARDFDRDERPARVRDFDRDERPLGKPRDLEREEAPARVRDFDRDERPGRGRELEREGGRQTRPLELEREGGRQTRPLELDREGGRQARPLDPERPALRARDELRDERAGRGLEREARPARGLEREERSLAKRDFDRERLARGRDDEPRRDRGLIADERDDRPRGRDLERERPLARDEARELGGRAARRELDERPAPKPREFERRPPFAKGAELEDEARGRELARGRRELDDRPALKGRGLDRDRELDRERDRELDLRASRRDGLRELERELPSRGGARRELERDLAPRLIGREGELEREGGRGGRRELEERPALRARGRDDEREPLRLRDEVRGPRREAELDERPRRRDEDERGEPRRSRSDSDRPLRGRGGELASRELPGRGLAKRSERDDEERLDDEPSAAARAGAGRERDDRIERDRPSRVRARARNRERVRELERERERE